MARLLITSGPTREPLDPVRYLTNASSGRMGQAITAAAIEAGHSVVVVSGPVAVEYPAAAEVISVVSTAEMLDACRRAFATCQGVIGVAAPCDFQPVAVKSQKIRKTGGPLQIELRETPDILATLAAERRSGQWLVGFALETDDQHLSALAKLQRKHCDLIVLNGPAAIGATESAVEVIDPTGEIVAHFTGPKLEIARGVLSVIQERLLPDAASGPP